MKHLDMFDDEIKVGDFVAGRYADNIAVFVVLSAAPKTLLLKKYNVKNSRSNNRRYPRDLIKLNKNQHDKMIFKILGGNKI